VSLRGGDWFIVGVAFLQVAAMLLYARKRDLPNATICFAAALMNVAIIWKNLGTYT
jgi:hypothetical protein